MAKKIVLCWSGGKDSTLALHKLLNDKEYKVQWLLTTVNEHYERVSMHGVRLELIEAQAESVGIPLEVVYVPEHCTNEIYDRLMAEKLLELKNKGAEAVAFGDIFLEDLRKYREERMQNIGIQPVFPLWKNDTKKLAEEFVQLGYKAVAVCIDNLKLQNTFAGAELDAQFFRTLPGEVDPCGENGEFHSFVYDGPVFSKPISVAVGEKVVKEYKGEMENKFLFSDLELRK